MMRIVTLACLMLMLAPTARAEDECRHILAGGIRDTFSSKKSERVDETIKKYINMTKTQLETEKRRVVESGGGGLDLLTINWFLGAEGGWKKETEEQNFKYVRDKLDSEFESRMIRGESINEFASVANESVVKAWDHCMGLKLQAKGLRKEEKISDENIVLTIRWLAIFEKAKTPSESFSLTTATTTAKVEGDVDAGDTTFTFARPDPHKQSIVIVQTLDGSVVSIADARPKDDEAMSKMRKQFDTERQEDQRHINWFFNWTVLGTNATASPAVFRDRIRLMWKVYKSPEFGRCLAHHRNADHNFATPTQDYTIRRLKADGTMDREFSNVRSEGNLLIWDDTDAALEPGVPYSYQILAFRDIHCEDERAQFKAWGTELKPGDRVNQYITLTNVDGDRGDSKPVVGSKAP